MAKKIWGSGRWGSRIQQPHRRGVEDMLRNLIQKQPLLLHPSCCDAEEDSGVHWVGETRAFDWLLKWQGLGVADFGRTPANSTGTAITRRPLFLPVWLLPLGMLLKNIVSSVSIFDFRALEMDEVLFFVLWDQKGSVDRNIFGTRKCLAQWRWEIRCYVWQALLCIGDKPHMQR